MKKLSTKIKNIWKSFKKIRWIKKTFEVIADSYGCVRSIFGFVFFSIKKPGTFYGYHAFHWAQKFADKRTKKWKRTWNQAGRKQGVFAYGDTTLLVCSAAELKIMKKWRMINPKINPRKAIKRSYYATAS